MFAGVAQVITGVFLTTVSGTVFVIGADGGLVGVKVTDNVRWPTASVAPDAGAYTNVPATLAVAFSCAALSAVKAAMGAGAFHVTAGVASTFSSTDAVAG